MHGIVLGVGSVDRCVGCMVLKLPTKTTGTPAFAQFMIWWFGATIPCTNFGGSCSRACRSRESTPFTLRISLRASSGRTPPRHSRKERVSTMGGGPGGCTREPRGGGPGGGIVDECPGSGSPSSKDVCHGVYPPPAIARPSDRGT